MLLKSQLICLVTHNAEAPKVRKARSVDEGSFDITRDSKNVVESTPITIQVKNILKVTEVLIEKNPTDLGVSGSKPGLMLVMKVMV